jgi:plastocyanin
MARCSPCSPCRSEARRLAALVLVAVALSGAPAAAGTVGGTVTVDRVPLRLDGPKHDRDVVLYLERAGGAHAPAAAHATMDQRGLVFIPHVLAVESGTTVTFLNNDNDQHNVYFLFDETGETLDIGTWGPGVSVDHRFEEAGEVIVLCKLHLEMAAYVLVVDGPLFVQVELGAPGPSAGFEIPDVPPGEYRLRAWHKKLKQRGGAAELTVSGGGRSEVDVVLAKRP